MAIGISEGGSEDASISVYDAATGKAIAGPVDRAQFGATAWSNDSKTLYFVRLKKLGPERCRVRSDTRTRRSIRGT